MKRISKYIILILITILLLGCASSKSGCLIGKYEPNPDRTVWLFNWQIK